MVTVRKGDIVINKPTDSIPVGGTLQLTATVQPSSYTVSWSSSPSSVATVDTNGLVTAKSAGTATITASTPGAESKTCKVTVRQSAITVTYPADTSGLASRTVTLYGRVSDSLHRE